MAFCYICTVEMRTAISILLCVCLSLPFSLKSGIMARYMVQQKYYAEVLCKNKDVPSMECKGKCQLMKELKDSEPVSEKEPGKAPESLKFEISLFIIQKSFMPAGTFYIIPKPLLIPCRKDILPGHTISVFHPPPYFS